MRRDRSSSRARETVDRERSGMITFDRFTRTGMFSRGALVGLVDWIGFTSMMAAGANAATGSETSGRAGSGISGGAPSFCALGTAGKEGSSAGLSSGVRGEGEVVSSVEVATDGDLS